MKLPPSASVALPDHFRSPLAFKTGMTSWSDAQGETLPEHPERTELAASGRQSLRALIPYL
eukprot:3178113-Rhodomonas_salina.1